MKRKTNNAKTFIDLFAGIGGFHLALNKLGLKCVAACEINEKARDTYEENFRKVSPKIWYKNQFWNDIRDITKSEAVLLPQYDILCAGFPCQPFSQAGKKNGKDHKDGTLFNEIEKIIRYTNPTAYILENVPNLLNIQNNEVFSYIQSSIKSLGYSFHPVKLCASNFGSPTVRKRLYMVGFKNDPNNKIPFEFKSLKRNKAQPLTKFFGYPWTREYTKTFRTGGFGSPVGERHNWTHYVINGETREITKDEAKIIMGFPKEYRFPKEKGVSDRIALKQLGNSIAVNVVYEIAKEVKKIINKYYSNGQDIK